MNASGVDRLARRGSRRREAASAVFGRFWPGAAALVVMRVRRLFHGILLLAIISISGAFFLLHVASPPPPVVRIACVEPAGVFDDNGEMWLVALRVANTNNLPRPNDRLYVEDVATPMELRVAHVWGRVKGSLTCAVGPGLDHETLLVVPAGADCCRLSFKYCGGSWSFRHQPLKASVEWLAAKLPLFIRLRFSSKFWRWAGFGPSVTPSRDWQRVNLELPIRVSASWPTRNPGAGHNLAHSLDGGDPVPVSCWTSLARRQ
jgi:hypothetical protein